MTVKVLVPVIGESVTEAEIARWLADDKQFVEKDEDIAEIDSEKATITISAEASGIINILVQEGKTVKIGALIAEIETIENGSKNTLENKSDLKPTRENERADEGQPSKPELQQPAMPDNLKMTPLARQIINTEAVDTSGFSEKQAQKKITKKQALEMVEAVRLRQTRTVKMSMLRRKLAERLVAVKNQTAMLTTFNEVDMSAIIEIRKKYQESFTTKHQVKLGFMSFFIKAAAIVLKEFPEVNAAIDGDNIIYHEYADISVAVSTDKGLMVPVIRNAEQMSLSDIEKALFNLAEKARSNSISIDDMRGGTFTITNGGVFGSMLSTPIINPPQSAILGMHNIQDRAVVINGEILIRPMMYLALSYDHRIIDGKESVGFVMAMKKLLESPFDMIDSEAL